MSVDPLKFSAPPHTDPVDEANRVPEGAVSPERMLAVLRRLQQDYYSNAEVQDQVAHAVRQDLGFSRTE
jgi:hypothetical protein